MTGTHLDGRANPGASRREGLWLFNKSLRRVEPACHRESVCAAECQLLRPERRSTDGSGGREESHLPAPTESVREPLDSYGSCHPDHDQAEGTHFQCANMRGFFWVISRSLRWALCVPCSRLYFLRIHRTR